MPDRPGRGRHLLREARRGRGLRRRRHRGHPSPVSAQSRQRRSRPQPARLDTRSRSSSTMLRWRGAGRMRCARPAPSVDVLVKVDVGFHRCGIDPEAAGAAEFIARVAEMPGLRFRGLLSHAGHAYGAHRPTPKLRAIAASEAATADRARGARSAISASPVEEISVGATPTARFSLQQQGLTELRPGNYVYYDRTQVALGAASLDDCALTVLARVVSRPAADRIILDCGSKTLASDQARGFERACRATASVFDEPRLAGARSSRCSSSGCRKSTPPCASLGGTRARARRPGARPAQPCVRRVEPRRRVWLVRRSSVRGGERIAARGRIA